MSITAIVLAGGQGSRMNHQDKAWVIHAGKPLILHVIDRIGTSVDNVIISRNRNHDGYDDLGFTCVADVLQGYQGPLAGIMSCAPLINTSMTMVLPCDTPNIPQDLTSRLLAGKGDAEIAIAAHDNGMEPLIFLADTDILISIRSYLDSGKRSVKGWHETHRHIEVSFGEGTSCFENINRLSQLQK